MQSPSNKTVINLTLNYAPREWQKDCHIMRKRFNVLALHRRAGKTELAIMQLIDSATKFTLDLGQFFYVAPFLKQAKAIAWNRLKQRLEPFRLNNAIDINESELSIRFKHNGSIIRIYGGDNPDGMRGVRLDGCVIDEVAQIKPEVWNDIIQPALSDRKGWCWFIGTPSGINLFSELYFKANKLEDWFARRYTVYDTDALDPAEVARLRRDMAETSFNREYLCDFTAAGDDQLISLSDLEQAVNRVLLPQDIELSPKILGVDPARFGGDRSVIFPRQGLLASKPAVYRGIDNMTLASYVAQTINDWKPDAVFIDSGAGAGVIDRLRQLGHAVTEVNFGGKADQPLQFLNKRAEMWWRMREWLNMGGVIPNDQDLKSDMAAPIYWYDSAQRIQLEPKDDIKKRGLDSPDMADALALTFAYPVAPKPHPLFGQTNRSSGQDRRAYNPYERLGK